MSAATASGAGAHPTSQPRIVIIGGGPTGLGAAYRLHELGYTNWSLIDRAPDVGGLSCTVKDDKGFLWDMGGHVIFSHYAYFDKAIDDAMQGAWCNHERESWVWMRNRFIPYPLQNNIHRLPAADLQKCLDGLVDITRQPVTAVSNFRDWIQQKFGPGLADVFMVPYNFKVWAFPPEAMDFGWMGERVATVDLKRILGNMVWQKDEKSWGPNATFRFPAHGGTGAIWTNLGARLPAANLKLGAGNEVTSIAVDAKTLTLASGERVPYDALITTMPMDVLVTRLADRPALAPLAPEFRHSSTHVIGVGLAGQPPAHLQGKCWMYFPEDDCPFYRVTLFSHYAPGNIPDPATTWSLMCEVSESAAKPVPGAFDAAAVIADTLAGLKAVGFITDSDTILTAFHRRLEYGYPTPFLGRDKLVHAVDDALRPAGIWSRGRFGAWKYEVANQDHSFMQGVEAVDNIVFGAEETTLRHPGVVNAGKAPLRAPALGVPLPRVA